MLHVGAAQGERLTGSARRAARVARHEVARWTPLAWRMLPALDQLRATRIDVSVPVGSGVVERPLTGDSLGLSAALALVSAWLQVPLPGDLAASAAIATDGTLASVGRVSDKVLLLRDLLPGVRRLAVAREQAESWRRVVASVDGVDVDIIGLSTVAEAITRFFSPGDTLAEVPTAERRRVVFGLTSLMARGHGALPDWRPVVSAVATIRSHWDLTDDEQHRLDLLDLASRRFAKVDLPEAPRGTTLDTLVDQAAARSALERGVHLALLIEHCNALALPLPPRLASVVEPMLDSDTHPFSIEVRGAHARWLATHQPGAALNAQQALLRELMDGRRLDSCSHALNESIRLAAVLDDPAAFGRLLEVEAQLRELGALSVVDQAFVNAAVCGGAALLGDRALSDARWARLTEGAGPKTFLLSWAHRLRCLSGVARVQDCRLLPHHAALHQLAEGASSIDRALAALGAGQRLAKVLLDQGLAHMLRAYPQ